MERFTRTLVRSFQCTAEDALRYVYGAQVTAMLQVDLVDLPAMEWFSNVQLC